jgi:hypothetical protein
LAEHTLGKGEAGDRSNDLTDRDCTLPLRVYRASAGGRREGQGDARRDPIACLAVAPGRGPEEHRASSAVGVMRAGRR